MTLLAILNEVPKPRSGEMPMKDETKWQVRVERQPHREAVRKLCAAYQQLSQETDKPEVPDETNSCIICASLDATTGAGSYNSQSDCGH
jgi:hypothetical protein